MHSSGSTEKEQPYGNLLHEKGNKFRVVFELIKEEIKLILYMPKLT